MYRVSKELSDAISGDNRRFAVKVTCLGEELPISISKIVYSGGCNGSDTLTIGNTVSAYIEITADSTEILLENKELCLYIGLKLNGKEEYIPIGSFTVKTIENYNGKITLTAYDRMVKLEGLYVTSLENYSISSILGEISNQKGIGIDIPESDIVLDKKPEGYTYREIIGYIASLLGKNALIDRNGRLVFKWYCDMEYTVYSDRIFSIKKGDKSYKIQKAECSSDAETVMRSGDGSRGISFSNPFMTQDILNSIYEVIEGMEFVPLSVSFLGDVTIDAGDVIKVYDKKSLYVVPVMNVEWEYDGGLISRIECVANTDVEEEIDFKGPVTTKIDNIFAELLKVDRFIAKAVTTETLAADVAQIDKLTSNDAIIHNIRATVLTADVINAAVADVGYITAEKADLKYLTSQSADVKYANITLANIDTANINKSKIGMLFSEVGLITSANIVNGHVTGYLDSVEINANKITAGTLAVDRLVIRGSEKSIIYELNNITGALQSQNTNTINGEILTKRTINCDKIVTGAITANEIAAGTITADKLNVNSVSAAVANIITLDAAKITSGTISADRIDINSLFARHITSTGGISTIGTYADGTTFENAISGGAFRTYVADGELAHITSIKVSGEERYFSILADKAGAISIGSGSKGYYFMNNGGNPNNITYRHQFIESVYIDGNLNVNGGIMKVGSKVELATNNEGGNIAWIAPDGTKWEFDCYNNNFRLFNYSTLKNFIIDKNGNVAANGYIKASGTNCIYGGDRIKMWTDNEGGNLEITSNTGTTSWQQDALGDTFRIYQHNNTTGANYFPITMYGYSVSINTLNVSNTLNGYNIGGSIAQNNNGLITGGNVYNALGNIQIVEIMTTGLLSTGSAVASGTTAVLSTSFEMWEGSTNYIVIPTLFRYCDIESISSSGGKLNITVRNISGASHTLSASFQIIYYKSK